MGRRISRQARFSVRLPLSFPHIIPQMELSRKTRAFRNMKEEADKCANQARGFAEEKAHLESDLYQKVGLEPILDD